MTVSLARSVYCAIQNREDQEIRIRCLLPATWGGPRSWKGNCSDLYTRKGPPRSLQVLRQTFSAEEDQWMLRVVAAMLGLRRTRQLNTPKHGFNMMIWSRLPEGDGYGDKAAFGTAVALALKAATGLARKRVDGLMVARAVAQGVAEVLEEKLPMADAVSSALGHRGCALLMEHGMDPNMQWIPVPRQCSVAAFDTGGTESKISPELRTAVETGAAMGLAHLNAALRKEKKPAFGGWGQVSPGEFEGGYRNHVPTKESGADWLKRFRNTYPELIDAVDPERPYRERALAEHQVRETARVRRMVSQLTEYSRTLREGFLVEAGRCLLSSHRSLKEKCNVAYDGADEVMAMIREKGRPNAVFGGRMCEVGRSGLLVLLAHESGLQFVREFGEAWRKKHKRGGTVVAETGDGGVLTGWWEGVLESSEEKLDPVAVGAEDGSAPKAKATKANASKANAAKGSAPKAGAPKSKPS